MSELRCPSSGYCWRDGRRKCPSGVEAAVKCHSDVGDCMARQVRAKMWGVLGRR